MKSTKPTNFDIANMAIVILAPRQMSLQRLKMLFRHYLPKGNILLGISKEPYVKGFEGQPQFRMLSEELVAPIVDQIQRSASPNKAYVRLYSQDETDDLVASLTSRNRVLLVNGSWQYVFHRSATHQLLKAQNVKYKYISPFVDEAEAIQFARDTKPTSGLTPLGTLLPKTAMMAAADAAAKRSFDNSLQVGVSLGLEQPDGQYELIARAFNEVIPYQSYALHHGNSRERHQSDFQDTRHYDTIHAEMALLVDAMKNGYSLQGKTLFIRLLPCPACARTLSKTGLKKLVYVDSHSGDYAVKLLEQSGAAVERLETTS